MFSRALLAVRLWPAEDYTRVTIESDAPLSARSFMVNEPPRLAVDIEGIDLLPGLRELVAQLRDHLAAGWRLAGDEALAGAQVPRAAVFGHLALNALILGVMAFINTTVTMEVISQQDGQRMVDGDFAKLAGILVELVSDRRGARAGKGISRYRSNRIRRRRFLSRQCHAMKPIQL
mgnify:CR=1 FL=1